jgi:hypothetical protein
MIKFVKKNLKLIIFNLLFFIIILFIVLFSAYKFIDFVVKNYPKYSNYPQYQSYLKSLYHRIPLVNLRNDYNVKFLPNIQYEKIELRKVKLKFLDEYYTKNHEKERSHWSSWRPFHIETQKKNIILLDYLGNIYRIKDDELSLKKNKINLSSIPSNLKDGFYLDSFILNNDLFVSYKSFLENEKCFSIRISRAKIDYNLLTFEDFYSPAECEKSIGGGRMQAYNHLGKEGIILTLSNDSRPIVDEKPQSDSSIFGKTIFIDLDNKNSIIFSKGHRVAQGLFVDREKNVILSTEHGPRGGDEINKIEFKKNYGWPIASYGEQYSFQYGETPYFKKNHEKEGLEEPIFAFVPSVGISELIKINNEFSTHFFKDNYLVSTLNDRSLYRVKFNSSYNRLIYIEKIYIGERIRDLNYKENGHQILLAFEENSELGIMTKFNYSESIPK